MITEKVGNLLESMDVDVVGHIANLFATMSAGVALSIKNKFPEAYDTDKATTHGDINKLGTYSCAKITDPKGTSIKFIINLYAMFGIGGPGRQLSYDHLVNGLTKLRDSLENKYKKGEKYTLGLPYKLGCSLAGGDFRIVRAIIESVFADSPIQVYIYYLPEFASEINKK